METQDLEEEEKKDINPALPDEGEFEEMERKREIKLPKRPIPATSLNIGKSVTVVTNYFKVEKPSDVIIHEYSISSQPPAYSNHRKLKRAIYLTLKYNHSIFLFPLYNLFSQCFITLLVES
jgi:hypothetical protein